MIIMKFIFILLLLISILYTIYELYNQVKINKRDIVILLWFDLILVLICVFG